MTRSQRVLRHSWPSCRALLVGEDGARYRIVVRNATTARFEIVASAATSSIRRTRS